MKAFACLYFSTETNHEDAGRSVPSAECKQMLCLFRSSSTVRERDQKLGVPAWGCVPDLSPNFGLQSGEVDGGDPTTRAGYLVWPGCTILETPFCRPSKGKNLQILPQKAGNALVSPMAAFCSSRWQLSALGSAPACALAVLLDAERCQSV